MRADMKRVRIDGWDAEHSGVDMTGTDRLSSGHSEQRQRR